jgi:hypothetical protein
LSRAGGKGPDTRNEISFLRGRIGWIAQWSTIPGVQLDAPPVLSALRITYDSRQDYKGNANSRDHEGSRARIREQSVLSPEIQQQEGRSR